MTRIINISLLPQGDGTGVATIYGGEGDTFADENFFLKHDAPGLLSLVLRSKSTLECRRCFFSDEFFSSSPLSRPTPDPTPTDANSSSHATNATSWTGNTWCSAGSSTGCWYCGRLRMSLLARTTGPNVSEPPHTHFPHTPLYSPHTSHTLLTHSSHTFHTHPTYIPHTPHTLPTHSLILWIIRLFSLFPHPIMT